MENGWKLIDAADAATVEFDYHATSAVVLTQDGRLLFQERDGGAPAYKFHIGTFGGAIDDGEADPALAMARELHEELGAAVDVADLQPLPCVYGTGQRGRELIYFYFWHDKDGRITGCYEGAPAYFASPADVLAHPRLMPNLKLMMAQGPVARYLGK